MLIEARSPHPIAAPFFGGSVYQSFFTTVLSLFFSYKLIGFIFYLQPKNHIVFLENR